MLTLIGYSVNDKVVVYDRMREIIDVSINETGTLDVHVRNGVSGDAADGDLGRLDGGRSP